MSPTILEEEQMDDAQLDEIELQTDSFALLIAQSHTTDPIAWCNTLFSTITAPKRNEPLLGFPVERAWSMVYAELRGRSRDIAPTRPRVTTLAKLDGDHHIRNNNLPTDQEMIQHQQPQQILQPIEAPLPDKYIKRTKKTSALLKIENRTSTFRTPGSLEKHIHDMHIRTNAKLNISTRKAFTKVQTLTYVSVHHDITRNYRNAKNIMADQDEGTYYEYEDLTPYLQQMMTVDV
ncbi:uncharacterized protein BX664DRAFT_347396 [Halteromyces radiatus]|uniref:uncharacterized protein n=1 Tax=Halteromyces radiatus TaxID=101107 RepID=UPI00221E37D8|nr:uncharacterized protein BX664DRAFT_347396 [Halteromyces radiatus]KAI8097414.1 hypothetical protein BX664DRAFT_347396 [Halteromyces radiatus]